MRVLALALLFAFALPTRAQRASDVPHRSAGVALTETPGTALTLGTLFNAETLNFSQSYEASYIGGVGGSVGLGMYTASLRWQPSAKLAGRVDVGVAHSLFGTEGAQASLGLGQADGPQVFLRNAELAYRPTENATIHLSISQSPYGRYASPYGTGYGASPYGLGRSAYGSRQQATLRVGGADDLFFRDGR